MPSPRRSWLAAALLAACPAASADIWTSHGPYGGNVVKVAAGRELPTTPLWAYGAGGVFRSTSTGSAWSRIERGLPPSPFVVDLEATPDGPVLYLASLYHVYRSRDDGNEWMPTSLPAVPARLVVDIAVRVHRDHIAVLTTQGVSLSIDGGKTYAEAAGLDPAASYGRIAWAGDGTLYLSVNNDPNGTHGGARLLRSVTSGAAWTSIALPQGMFGVLDIFAAPESASLVYVTDGTTLFGSTDAGASWLAVGAPAGCYVSALQTRPGDPFGLYAGCHGYGAAYAPYAPSAVWTRFDAANGLTVNGTGDTAEIRSLVGLPTAANEPPTLVAGSASGGLLRTTDGGATWAPANSGFESVPIRALATHPTDARVVLAGQADAGATSPGLFRSVDAGASWSVSNTHLNAEQIRAIVIDPTTTDADPGTDENFTVYAAGYSDAIPDEAHKDGGIYKSTDRGTTWTTIDSGIAQVNGRPDMGLVRGLLLDPRSCAAPPPSGPCPAGGGPLRKLFAVGSGVPDRGAAGLPYKSARIYRNNDAGAGWSASDNGLPLPVERPGSIGGTFAMGGVAAIVADRANGDTLYVGTFLAPFPPGPQPTIANGVFKSTDGGLNWIHRSIGLPRVGADGTSHHDVLALAINPFDGQVLYAAVSTPSTSASAPDAAIYKSTDGGATWLARTRGIAGRDIRALYVDPNDATGNTVYAAAGGSSADPGGVYRTTDGGATWNSRSRGLPTRLLTALAMPPRAIGAPARVLAGGPSGVWDYAEAPDGDDDGAPDAIEAQVGDGNIDGIADATQRGVASVAWTQDSGIGGSFLVTTAIVSGCAQLNNSEVLGADGFPTDPAGHEYSHAEWELIRIELPDCASAVVDVTYHNANFANGNHVWRNYGPTTPGADGSFAWYSFARATRVGPQTWRLTLDASRQGNWRNDANNILFFGGPADLPDLIFANGFE